MLIFLKINSRLANAFLMLVCARELLTLTFQLFLKKFPELKFRYVEEDQPEEFFIPYVWSMVQSTSALCWSNDEITMGMNNETK